MTAAPTPIPRWWRRPWIISGSWEPPRWRWAKAPSPACGVNEVFELTGMRRIAQERGAPLLDFDAQPYQELNIPHGRVVDRIKVTWFWHEYDFIVSLPVMKTHMHTGVSLSIKNMKGMLWRRQKVAFHQIHCVGRGSAGQGKGAGCGHRGHVHRALPPHGHSGTEPPVWRAWGPGPANPRERSWWSRPARRWQRTG